ncbi:putative uncharacterized membrane protein [Portunus trituberculatus]|uniref:Uncharacterized membrane protein n=1 Tax=Portunus trituberculatus TaxID=210409 RepID=A0A5B7JQ48_PORTR|nr:putative uncharacterized membrane protein [Portunus trituberculatus]
MRTGLSTLKTCQKYREIYESARTLRPFQAVVALQMSSPTFLGDRPRGPTLGASEDVAPTSPPTARSFTEIEDKRRKISFAIRMHSSNSSLFFAALGFRMG